ncbi:RNA helicase [Ephemerocybe angulata]|uniref:ATP-dependent RNA helicase n=1 Tax=Ephemerocybe angulata TaxID=980116 RepID=A0A8H6I522_9AGAR|nr:RNA helicase [Tulosesus angulatus]
MPSILPSAARTGLRAAVRASLRRTATVSRSFASRTAHVAKRAAAAPTGLRHASTVVEAVEANEALEEDVEENLSEAAEEEDVELFSSLEGKVDPKTLKALTESPFQYEAMSVVQARILPLLPELVAPREEANPHSIDLLVKARTGTGKTIGFLVPAIEARIKELERVSAQESSQTEQEASRARSSAARRFAMDNVGTLVISPTRELASQIAVEAQKLTSHHAGFGVSLFVGGVDKRGQLNGFNRGRKDILVATPGRLKDFLSDPRSGVAAALKDTKMLILDEADTLLDMGFREDIEEIMRVLPSNATRQTFLFSATVSKGIQQIAHTHLAPNHRFVNCVSQDTSEVHDHIDQFHTVLPSPKDQLPHIMRLLMQDQLQHGDRSKVVLFLPTTKMTMLMSSAMHGLSRKVLPGRTDVFELHSKRTMGSRTKAAEMFRRTTRPSILVTSDVSARGVDYPGVTRVIQIGLPKSADQYVHRVGRTGRGSSKVGRGDLVLLDWEAEYVRRQYSHLPLKPLSAATFAAELQAAVDAAAHAKLQAVHPELQNTVEEYLAKEVDEEAVGESMMSMIGFYAGLASGMRMDVDGIAGALQKWSTEGMGLERAPYVGAAFLSKLGGGRGGFSRGGGGSRGGRDGQREGGFGARREWTDRAPRDGFAKKPWEARGSFGGERKSFGERKPWEERGASASKPWEKKPWEDRGASKPWEKKPWEDRPSRSFAPRDDSEGGSGRSSGYLGRRSRSFEARNGGSKGESDF